jgi:hypothetical protein
MAKQTFSDQQIIADHLAVALRAAANRSDTMLTYLIEMALLENTASASEGEGLADHEEAPGSTRPNLTLVV